MPSDMGFQELGNRTLQLFVRLGDVDLSKDFRSKGVIATPHRG
jgi:hypothetical protein